MNNVNDINKIKINEIKIKSGPFDKRKYLKDYEDDSVVNKHTLNSYRSQNENKLLSKSKNIEFHKDYDWAQT